MPIIGQFVDILMVVKRRCNLLGQLQ